tara:strand:- start:59 stop:406 length:348 start_codon:yes stop_codon:yes gene_type:complete
MSIEDIREEDDLREKLEAIKPHFPHNSGLALAFIEQYIKETKRHPMHFTLRDVSNHLSSSMNQEMQDNSVWRDVPDEKDDLRYEFDQKNSQWVRVNTQKRTWKKSDKHPRGIPIK